MARRTSKKQRPRGGSNRHADGGVPPRSSRSARPGRRGDTVRIGQLITTEIGPLTLEGEAIARYENYVLFVAGAVPGEKVVIEVTSSGPRYGRARVVRIVHRSPARVEPRCRHFGACGGCSWQHIRYADQLRWKERLLRETLEHQLSARHLPIEPMIGMADPWATRNKVHFLVGTAAGRTALGHFRAHSRDFIPVSECPVHHAVGNRVARSLLLQLDKHGVTAADAAGANATARHVQVRVAADGTAAQLTLVASRAKFPGLPVLGNELMNGDHSITGVHLNVNSEPGTVVFGPNTVRLSGSERMVEEIAGVKFLISPTSFFQTNSLGAARLVESVLRYVPPLAAGSVLDLYAGVGLFAAPLSKRGHRVVAVEENPNAVSDGIETLKLNRITGCRFISGKVETTLKKLANSERFQVAILDPPRDGCPDWALRLLARKIRPQHIIDVSCDASALGRDLAVLTTSGYRVMEVQPIDMFPHTSHIESVSLLSRATP